MTPNRWLHLRHPDGFDDEAFELFRAHCRIWEATVQATLAEWSLIQPGAPEPPRYVVFPPERSDDGTVVTLPLGGQATVGSRATFEDHGAELLSRYFPLAFRLGMEEGLTETLDAQRGPRTSWRSVLRP